MTFKIFECDGVAATAPLPSSPYILTLYSLQGRHFCVFFSLSSAKLLVVR